LLAAEVLVADDLRTLANFSFPSPAFDIYMSCYGISTTFSAQARFAAADFLYTPPAGFLPFL